MKKPINLSVTILSQRLAICRLEKGVEVPDWAGKSCHFLSITRTDNELSVVCEEGKVPPGVQAEKGWRAIKIEGTLDFSLTGILASLVDPLAAAKISVFAISTYETDYLLVKDEKLDASIKVLGEFCELKS